MTLILAQKNRKLIRDVQLTDANDAVITVVEADKLRLKVGRSGQTPLVDLSSEAASANGSTITINHSSNTHRVELVAADMNLLSQGVYSFELALVDSADGSEIKHVDYQVMVVQATQTGGTS